MATRSEADSTPRRGLVRQNADERLQSTCANALITGSFSLPSFTVLGSAGLGFTCLLIAVAAGCSSSGHTGSPQSGGSAGSSGNGGAPSGGSPSAGAAGHAGASVGGSGGEITFDPGTLTVERVATWKNDATAAYTMIHDDTCDFTTSGLPKYADPELFKRGLVAGFGAIVHTCVTNTTIDQWAALAQMVAHGDEILNHTWSHQDLTTDRDYATEVDLAATTLEQHGITPTFFIFPEDLWDDQSLTYIKDAGYLGARAGIRAVNAKDFSDPFAIDFDVYGPYSATDPQNRITIYPGDTLKAHVDAAVAIGGWAVRELHGVEDNSWNSVPLADYQAHLDYVKGLVDAGTLWVGTPSEVVRYAMSRENCGVPSAATLSIEFPTPNITCTKYATALSIVVHTAIDVPALRVTQNGTAVLGRKTASSAFIVDVDPAGGAASVIGVSKP